MSSEDVFGGFRAVLIARILRTVSSGLVVLLLSRFLLTPDEYGLLFLAISVLGVALLFGRLGFAKSAARYVSEYRESDPGQIPHIVWWAFACIVATTAIVGLATYLLADTIAVIFDEPEITVLVVLGVGYLVGQSLSSFSAMLFQGFNKVGLSAVVQTVRSVGLPIFVTAFVLLGFGPAGAMLGYVTSSLIASVVGIWLLYRVVGAYNGADRVESGLVRRIVEYNVPLTATKGANVLDKRIDTVLVGLFLTPTAVAFYTLGKQLAEFVMVPASALGFTVSPSYGERKASDELSSAARIYRETFQDTLLLYVPAAAGIVLVADPAIPMIFGPGYAGAVPVLQILAVYVVLQAITKITSTGIDYLGRAKVRAIAKGAASVGNALLNILLIPTFGVVGAAAATVLTHSLYVGLNVYIIGTELSLSLRWFGRTVARAVAVTAVMTIVVVFAMPRVSGIPSLLAVITLGVAVWATVAVAGGFVDRDRVEQIIT